jgi:hypothetical protein
MPFPATVYRVMIGSPGDLGKIREFARDGKPCGLFFKKGNMPMKHDTDQYRKLQEFEQEVRDPQGEFRGPAKEFRTELQLRTAVSRFLTDTVRRLAGDGSSRPKEDDRIGRVEEIVRDAKVATAANRLAGGSPLDEHFIREDMSRKACISIASVGPIKGTGEVTVNLWNEGQFPARNVAVAFDTGKGFPTELPKPRYAQIDPARAGDNLRRFTASFKVPPPELDPSGNPIPGQERTIHMKVWFRDGLDRPDEAVFRLVLRSNGRMWDVEEDLSKVILSPLCRHIRPQRPPDLRPRNLTAEDHKILETLVRRAATKPGAFRPMILTNRMGDDKRLYASVLAPGSVSDPEDRDNPQHDRDFLPTLVQQGFLIQDSLDEYTMDESLFRAYGFEPPT